MLCVVVEGKLTFFITFVICLMFIYCTRNYVFLHEHVDYFPNNIVCHLMSDLSSCKR